MGVFSKEVITPFTTASASFSPTTSTFLPFANSSSRALVNWFSMSGRRVLLENCGMAIFFTSGGRELTVPARWYPQAEKVKAHARAINLKTFIKFLFIIFKSFGVTCILTGLTGWKPVSVMQLIFWWAQPTLPFLRVSLPYLS